MNFINEDLLFSLYPFIFNFVQSMKEDTPSLHLQKKKLLSHRWSEKKNNSQSFLSGARKSFHINWVN